MVSLMIYLDNAATTWPKPESVYKAVDAAMRECGGNPGRGNHSLSSAAGRIVYETRMLCAQLFHAPNPECICFTSNTTESLNLSIKGVVRPGDHVITSQMEHNSVSRPLKKLESLGVSVTKVTTSPESGIDLETLAKAFRKNTRLVICNHISNVTGTINPIREIGRICRDREVLFLVDAAQSAGMFPIDVQGYQIDLLAFPGHKGLLGPQGTGGLFIRDGLFLETLKEGGTGTQSELSDQPLSRPGRYESGTMNLPGLAGMAEGIKYILSVGLDNIERKEAMLTDRLLKGLAEISGVKVWGPGQGSPRGSVVSISIENISPGDAAIILDNTFGIITRAGLHCARDAHETLGTIDKGGTLRFSPGWFNTEQDIKDLIEAISSISQEM
jgi:cysteine desulfurase family protein